MLRKIVDVVSIVTEVREEDILSHSRKADIVLARKLTVVFAMSYQIPTLSIAKFLGITQQAVRDINSRQENSKIYAIFKHQIRKKLETMQ